MVTIDRTGGRASCLYWQPSPYLWTQSKGCSYTHTRTHTPDTHSSPPPGWTLRPLLWSTAPPHRHEEGVHTCKWWGGEGGWGGDEGTHGHVFGCGQTQIPLTCKIPWPSTHMAARLSPPHPARMCIVSDGHKWRYIVLLGHLLGLFLLAFPFFKNGFVPMVKTRDTFVRGDDQGISRRSPTFPSSLLFCGCPLLSDVFLFNGKVCELCYIMQWNCVDLTCFVVAVLFPRPSVTMGRRSRSFRVPFAFSVVYLDFYIASIIDWFKQGGSK